MTEMATIPYSLKDATVLASFEDDGQPVHMGDMVSITVFGRLEDEHMVSGELGGVHYGNDGFIDSVSLWRGDDWYLPDVPCEGIFFRPKEAGND